MEPKKFKLDDQAPSRELFHTEESYFEKLPVRLADRLHKKEETPAWKKWLVPGLGIGFGAVSLVVLSLLVIPRMSQPQQIVENTGSPVQQSEDLTSQDIYHVMVNEEEFSPTEDELIEQLTQLEDNSDKKAIEDFLDEHTPLYEGEILEEI
jgi:hypothetical protein